MPRKKTYDPLAMIPGTDELEHRLAETRQQILIKESELNELHQFLRKMEILKRAASEIEGSTHEP